MAFQFDASVHFHRNPTQKPRPTFTHGHSYPGRKHEPASHRLACLEQKLLSPPIRHRCGQIQLHVQQHRASHPKLQPQNLGSFSTEESGLLRQESQTPVSANNPSTSATKSPRDSNRWRIAECCNHRSATVTNNVRPSLFSRQSLTSQPQPPHK